MTIPHFETVKNLTKNQIRAFNELKSLIYFEYGDVITGLWYIDELTENGGTQFIFKYVEECNQGRKFEFYNNFVCICNKYGMNTEVSYSYQDNVLSDKGLVKGTQEYIKEKIRTCKVIEIINYDSGEENAV